ncbi:MAG: hypothetical protein GXO75_11045 [Calditrichaeota bacterium]|nr:hypothetical protein [Calditrichota bacterium]
MGELEEERQIEELCDPNSFSKFVDFLEEVYEYFLSKQDVSGCDDDKIKGFISLRKLLNRYGEVFG